MERKTAGLLGALAGIAVMGGGARAASPEAAMPHDPLAASSYADLLAPVPGATAALKAHDASLAAQPASAPLQQADWHHHHHHHHHHWHRPPPPPRWHHHHHHHHHSGVVLGVPGVGVVIHN